MKSNKKSFCPHWWILGLTIIFVLFPLGITVPIIIFVKNDGIVFSAYLFAIFLPIFGIAAFIMVENIEINLTEKVIRAYEGDRDPVNASTVSFDEILDARFVKLTRREMRTTEVGREKLRTKLLEIDCKNNIKRHFSLQLFTKRQIQKIIALISYVKTQFQYDSSPIE